jgi:hypothetical protein
LLDGGDLARSTKKKKRTEQATTGRAGGPTRKRLEHIANDVMAQERQDRRSLDQQAEQGARKKRNVVE